MMVRNRNNKKGQMLVLAAVSASALIALAGFGLDISNLIIRQYQLQRSLDSAVLNCIVYTEKNINRSMNNENVLQTTYNLVDYSTAGNLKMMGIDIKPGDLVIGGSSDGNVGTHVFLSGQEVAIGCDTSEVEGCDVPTNVSSVKVCVIAKLKTKTLLLHYIGIPNVTLKATACSRRISAAIALVLDTSGSMAGDPLDDLKAGAVAFIDEFQEGLDMMSIITFGTQARVIQPMERIIEIEKYGVTGKAALKEIIARDVVAGGNTNIAEGLILARKEVTEHVPAPINNEPGAFKVIVLFSDGAPNAMTVDWANPRSSTQKDETDRYVESPFLADNSDMAPVANTEFVSRYVPLSAATKAQYPDWRENPLSGNNNSTSDEAAAYDGQYVKSPQIPWATSFYTALRELNPDGSYKFNPYKSRPGVWSWQPLAENTLGSNNPTSNAYSYSTGSRYVYTSIQEPGNTWQMQLMLPNVNANTEWSKTGNLPCSSDGYGHGTMAGNFRYLYFLVYDNIDCLKDYTYKDSKGISTDEFGYIYGKWISSSPSNTSYILQEYYHNAIIEADHALKDGITIYAVGLALKKPQIITNGPTPVSGGIGTAPPGPTIIDPGNANGK